MHATVDIGLGGVGHVDVGLKLHRMCTLRWIEGWVGWGMLTLV